MGRRVIYHRAPPLFFEGEGLAVEIEFTPQDPGRRLRSLLGASPSGSLIFFPWLDTVPLFVVPFPK